MAALSVAATAKPSDTVSQGPADVPWDDQRIDSVQAKRMTGVSWRPGCPVATARPAAADDVALGLRRTCRNGKADRASRRRAGHGRRLPRSYTARASRSAAWFRSTSTAAATSARSRRTTRRRSTAATSRGRLAGRTTRTGRAIDVNPIENPYVSGGRTSHPASRSYVDRARRRPGMAYEGGALVRAFDRIGWGWGGRWTSVKDYQHFSASGR